MKIKSVQIAAMKKIIFTILLLSLNAFAQHEFEIKNASENFDVKINVAECSDGFCEGEISYSISKKGEKEVFQKFTFDSSNIWLGKDEKPQTNFSLMYDEQSVLHFDDFNFDGVKDLALNDGKNGGYGSPSYQIYLYSKSRNKFVHSSSFTKLSQGTNLGMFEVDKEKKMIYVYSKSGCCWHMREGFEVVKNRPLKVYEFINDATGAAGFVKMTTRKLVNGKWQTKVEKEKMEDDQ